MKILFNLTFKKNTKIDNMQMINCTKKEEESQFKKKQKNIKKFVVYKYS